MLKIKAAGAFLLAVLVISGCGADTILTAEAAAPAAVTIGAQLQRGFLNDNVYHSDLGDIHYSSYIPESYDGSEPYPSLLPCLAGKDCTSRVWEQIWRRTSARRPSGTTTG